MEKRYAALALYFTDLRRSRAHIEPGSRAADTRLSRRRTGHRAPGGADRRFRRGSRATYRRAHRRTAFCHFGNITELIISILAPREGLIDVVKASIIGAILGNALLVLGVAVCVGGFKNGRLKFEARPASQ